MSFSVQQYLRVLGCNCFRSPVILCFPIEFFQFCSTMSNLHRAAGAVKILNRLGEVNIIDINLDVP